MPEDLHTMSRVKFFFKVETKDLRANEVSEKKQALLVLNFC